MKQRILAAVLLALLLLVACRGSDSRRSTSPLLFEPDTGDFSFTDSDGNRLIYERMENTLIVEPDIDVDQLAVAFCQAEQQTSDPARFSAVTVVLAEALVPFIETVERVCER